MAVGERRLRSSTASQASAAAARTDAIHTVARKRFEAIADNAKLSSRAVVAFQKLVEERGLAFLEEMDAWLSGNEIDETSDTEKRAARLGVGVYLIYDEIQQG